MASSISRSADGSDTLLAFASWSLNWKHCRAAERHWKADQSHAGAEPDSSSSPYRSLGFDGIFLTFLDGHLLGVCKKLRSRVCQHVSSLSNAHESTLEMVSKWKKINKKICAHVTEKPKITHLVVSQSHSPFFLLLIFLSWWNPDVQHQPLKITSLWLSAVMETSQVSVSPAVAPAVHCEIRGLVLKNALLQARQFEAFSETDQPTNFCCILSVWTLAGNLRMPPGTEKPQSHLYIVLFLMFVCMYVGVVYACI